MFCSAKVCEEKLRYAAYNCVAIDTDMSPWEEWSRLWNEQKSKITNLIQKEEV